MKNVTVENDTPKPNHSYSNVMGAILTASFSTGKYERKSTRTGKYEQKSISKLSSGGVRLGMYFCYRKTRSKKGFKPLVYPSLASLSTAIQDKLITHAGTHYNSESELDLPKTSISSLSDSSLSEALNQLNNWGIIKFETYITPKIKVTKQKYANNRCIRVTIQKNALKNVVSRIKDGTKQTPNKSVPGM